MPPSVVSNHRRLKILDVESRSSRQPAQGLTATMDGLSRADNSDWSWVESYHSARILRGNCQYENINDFVIIEKLIS
jgi:hypothetical protein